MRSARVSSRKYTHCNRITEHFRVIKIVCAAAVPRGNFFFSLSLFLFLSPCPTPFLVFHRVFPVRDREKGNVDYRLSLSPSLPSSFSPLLFSLSLFALRHRTEKMRTSRGAMAFIPYRGRERVKDGFHRPERRSFVMLFPECTRNPLPTFYPLNF